MAGGAGVPLTAAVSGSTGAVGWTLSGPGALTQQSGHTTLYSPPDCLDHPATATVTASAEGASASVTFDIQPAANAACLTISPDNGEVTIGENPLTLKANAPPSVGSVSWSLFGPGSLSDTTGPTTVYSPPGFLDRDLNVTITASAPPAAVARATVRVNPRRVFKAGTTPMALAFDGANLLVANWRDSNILKLRVSDGEPQGTIPCGPLPYDMVLEGENVWVATVVPTSGAPDTNRITKMRIKDGVNLGTFDLGPRVRSLAFDGALMWFSAGDTVGRLHGNAELLGSTALANAQSLTFDGTDMWVANGGVVTHLRRSDGANLANVYVGLANGYVGAEVQGKPAMDRAGVLWVMTSWASVVRVDTATGWVLGSSPLPDISGWLRKLMVDGDSVWTLEENRVVKRRASDLAVQKIDVIPSAWDMLSDGTHVWVSSSGGNYVARL
jgi:hypothetical protein